MSTTTESPAEALARIQSAGFGRNDALAILAFSAAGISPADITPRHNVLTFRAWRAAGRQVAKGAKSVPVTVWIRKKGAPLTFDPKADPEKPAKGPCWPKTTALFHVSQTNPIDSPLGTRPAAWANPVLIRPGTYDAE